VLFYVMYKFVVWPTVLEKNDKFQFELHEK